MTEFLLVVEPKFHMALIGSDSLDRMNLACLCMIFNTLRDPIDFPP